MLYSDVELLRGREHHFLFPLHPWRHAEAIVRERPAPVLVHELGPFVYSYVPDLVATTAPMGSACWVLIDEKTSEEDEKDLRAQVEHEGFREREPEIPLLTDPDNEARTRWVKRGTRRVPVRLLRYER
jgi:hypothetical protein